MGGNHTMNIFTRLVRELTLYENIKRITIPLDPRHLLYLTTEDDADHVTIIDRALQIKQG